MTTDRTLFEDFQANSQFAELRKLRSQLQPQMEAFRSNFRDFQCGRNLLDPEYIRLMRQYMLHMLQLEHAMTEACKDMPVELEPVKVRILKDFDTNEPMAYLTQVNGWLRLIENPF